MEENIVLQKRALSEQSGLITDGKGQDIVHVVVITNNILRHRGFSCSYCA